MPKKDRDYYIAMVASLISTLGWLGGAFGLFYTFYLLVGDVSGDPWNAAIWTFIAFGLGITFALVEKNYHRVEY